MFLRIGRLAFRVLASYQSIHVDAQITEEAQEEQDELQDDVLACACERTQLVHPVESADEEYKDRALQNGQQRVRYDQVVDYLVHLLWLVDERWNEEHGEYMERADEDGKRVEHSLGPLCARLAD